MSAPRRPPDGEVSGGGQAGAALLIVIGATAALALPVTLLLYAAGTAYAVQGYRSEREQAAELAGAVLVQVRDAVTAGVVPPPSPGRTVTVRNGVLEASGAVVAVARFPLPPGTDRADWPAVTDSPPWGDPPVFGLGAEVELSAVTGPRGDARGRGLVPDGSLLVDLEVRAWFRRAVVETTARGLLEDGRLLLLD